MEQTIKKDFKVTKIPFAEVPQLSKRDKAYVSKDLALDPFYKYEVELSSFPQIISDKLKEDTNRSVLVQTLEKQYVSRKMIPIVDQQIQLLLDNKTFTIITAHQPSLFTGPLYYIYKIVSTINLCQQLNEQYPSYQFVPIFVSGGEDHDFEEVNHTHLFNNNIVWQSGETGAVGNMKTASLRPVLEELKQIVGESENAKTIFEKIERTHTENEFYGEATLAFAHEIFGDLGLVVLNMNEASLKSLLKPIIKDELLNNPSKNLVDETQEQLAKAGFKSQAYPREINLFYLVDQIRSRIVFEENQFKVLNTDIVFTKDEILKEVDQHPERFSPNVVLRPIYQELVLPNLAYIGGGGELAYWMERQSQFQHFGINFPMLIRRNSVMWLDKGNTKKMIKLGLDSQSIFGDTDALIKSFVTNESDTELNLNVQKNQLTELYSSIAELAQSIDPTLKKSVEAEQSKQLKVLNQLEARLLRAEKQKHDVSIKQIRGLKEKLFPKNGLQERHDNFISFYLKYGDEFIATLLKNLNPLTDGFVVISEDV